MPEMLYAWSGSRLVGKFTKSGDHIGFEYAPGYSACAYIRCGADGNMGFQRVGNEGSNCTP